MAAVTEPKLLGISRDANGKHNIDERRKDECDDGEGRDCEGTDWKIHEVVLSFSFKTVE